MFEDDPRWSGVADRERQELLRDFQKDSEKREEAARKADKERRRKAFRDLLDKLDFIDVGDLRRAWA
jgi:hypothetical protein